MQKNFEELQMILAGKNRKRINEEIESGLISCSRRRYRIVEDERTISGLAADFVPAYRKVLAESFGLENDVEPSGRAMKKLDAALSNGYMIASVADDEVIYTKYDARTNVPKKVRVIHMAREGNMNDTMDIVVVRTTGRLLQGSMSMIRTREQYKKDLVARKNEQ